MKTIKQIILASLGLFFLALQSCTHEDYVPVPGPGGKDGSDGIAGTTSCELCHSTEHKKPIMDAWSLSSHKGSSFHGGNTAPTFFSDGSVDSESGIFCSQCHTQEGFIDNVKYGKLNPNGYIFAQNAISCEGCHGTTHRSFNFLADGNDFGLRTIDAVVCKLDPKTKLSASSTGGASTSNVCVECHQSGADKNGFAKRPVLEAGETELKVDGTKGTTPVITGGATPTYRYWSKRALAIAFSSYPKGTTNYKTYTNVYNFGSSRTPLHGLPAADIWMGVTGIDIPVATTRLPESKTSSHYTKASCVQCHMDTPKDGDLTKGSHTMVSSFNTCVTCHTDVETLYADFKTKYNTEFQKLVEAFSGTGPAEFFTVSANPSATTGFKTISIKTGADLFGTGNTPPTFTSSIDGTPYSVSKEVPLKYVQAFWNYKLLVRDNNNGKSRGVHNPNYTIALIKNSTEALKN